MMDRARRIAEAAGDAGKLLALCVEFSTELFIIEHAESSRPKAACRCEAVRQKHRLAKRRRHRAGRITPKLRLLVLSRDAFRCRYCNRTDLPLHVDHIIPIAAGGQTEMANLQALCNLCNIGKADD